MMNDTPANIRKSYRSRLQAGNAIVMLFAAIGMAGVVTYGLNNVMRGPATTTAEVSRRTMAENNLIATSRLAVAAAVNQQDRGGDCDGDGFVEPLPYRDAGVLPKPAGGGLVPMSMGASMNDPWGTQYGYCAWDPGTASVSNAIDACGGATPRRLQGAPRDDQYAIAIISAGKNGAFETTCNGFVDANADNLPDTPLLNKPAGSDDVVLSYTYAEANGIGGGEWKLKDTAGVVDSTTATIGKNLEVGGGATFTEGGLELGFNAAPGTARGLVLPRDPGDDTITGACIEAKEKQLRLNVGDGSEVPKMEICHDDAWVPVTGGASSGGGSCTPVHDTWVQRTSAGSRPWSAIASSADGKKLVAVDQGSGSGGKIYTSTDSGATWTARDSDRSWSGVASSDDGTKLVTGVWGGTVYTSTNSGATWTARAGSGSRNWHAFASSADGTKLVGAVLNGQIYTSTDSGVTWTARESNRMWSSVASSADGTRLGATALNGQLYISSDSGVTWTARNSNRYWYRITTSSDGLKFAAVDDGGYIYTSTDGGVNWTARTSAGSRNWLGIASSADGTRLAATVQYGKIYTSEDSGATWVQQPVANGEWGQIVSSANGKKLALLVESGNYLYTSDGGCPDEDGGGGGGGSTPDCVAGPVGTVCADGAIYVGDFGGTRRYVKAEDSAGAADVQWKTASTATSGTGSTTDGVANTDAIIAAGAASHPAGAGCRADGAEWYLPSRDELTLVYTNKATAGVSITGWHWSSSQGGSGNSYVHSREMGGGGTATLLKTESYKIRCMRQTIPSDTPSGGGGGGDTHRTVFRSSVGSYTGNLGGLAGGDAKCNALASAAGLPGTFMAWLADDTGSPSTRFEQSTVPYKLMNGTTIANNWADLIDGTLSAPINVNESGGAANGGVWTNVTDAGIPINNARDCNQWTSSSSGQDGRTGDSSRADAWWTYDTTVGCDFTKALFCFQQGPVGGGGEEEEGEDIDNYCGIDWTARSASQANSWMDVTYGGNLFVAVASSGTNRVMTSPDGITWTNRTASQANSWKGVAYGNGTFVAVSYDGTNRVMTSPDGITWTNRTASQANSWMDVTYANGLFVAIGQSGTNRVMTSPDGITWTNRTASVASLWTDITHGNGLFVAVAQSATNNIMTSPDGVTWTTRTSPIGVGFWDVDYGNGMFVAVPMSGSSLVTSPDGITWTERTFDSAGGWSEVVFVNDKFVALSTNASKRLMTSKDGISWTSRDTPELNVWEAAAYGNNTLVAVSSSGTNRVMTSNCAGDKTQSLLTPHPLDVGLIAHWKMDEGSGTTVRDHIGGHDGTFVNTPQWAADGPNGSNSLVLNKEDRDHIRIDGLLEEPGSYTIAAWVNLHSIDTIGAEILSPGDRVSLRIEPVGPRVSHYNGSTYQQIESQKFVIAQGWKYVVGTFDSAQGILRSYVDGVMDNELTSVLPVVYTGGTDYTTIGAHANAQVTYDFDGGIDDVRFYGRALGPAEVAALYDREKNSSVVRQKAYTTTALPTNQIAASDDHTCAINTDQTIWCTGSNVEFELGNINYLGASYYPVRANSNMGAGWSSVMATFGGACGLQSDGTLWCWGTESQRNFGDGIDIPETVSQSPMVAAGGMTFSKVSARWNHMCGITLEGRLYCWGSGTDGKLGNGATSIAISPVAVGTDLWVDVSVGYNNTCGIKADGSGWCWGDDTYGQLGNGSTLTADQTSPSSISGNMKWSRITSGIASTCGVTTDGKGWCWGDDANMQIGNGATTGLQHVPTPVAGDYLWKDIQIDHYAACGLTVQGKVYCWGEDTEGQLGDDVALASKNAPSPVPLAGKAIALDLGHGHACAMLEDRTLWCWGRNTFGQLGSGTALGTANQPTPVPALGFPNAAPWLWNDAHNAISLNPGTTLALGDKWLSDDGTEKYFGFTERGKGVLSQSGVGSHLVVETTASAPVQMSFRKTDTAVPADYTTGLAAEWLFNEATGATVAASNVGSVPATASGAGGFNATGGRGVSPGGVLECNEKAWVANNAAILSPVTSPGLSVWINPYYTQDATIVSKTHTNHTGAIKQTYGIGITSDRKITFTTGYTGANHVLKSKSSVNPNAWTHVVVSYTPGGTAPQKKIYINGVLDAVATEANTLAYDGTGSGQFFICSAGCTGGGCEGFVGGIDDLRLYNVQLTDAGVKQLHLFQKSGVDAVQTIGVNSGTGAINIGRNNAAASSWIDSITPDFSLTSAGNIGVGTMAPAAAVDVQGGVRVGYQSQCTAAGTMRYKPNIRDEECLTPTYSYTARENSRSWQRIASSSDNMKMVASVINGNLYTTWDGGVTWTARDSSRQWLGVAASADGTRMVAATTVSGTGGYIYTSSDSGVTWTQRAGAGLREWRDIAMSADGMRIVTGAGGGQIYVSTNGGSTWAARDSNRGWHGFAMSADGMKMLASVPAGQLYTSSDGGVTWTPRDSNRDWRAVAMSADGKKQAAIANAGQIYISLDSGVTWAPRADAQAWIAVDVSGDGSTFVAAINGGGVYSSIDNGVTWVQSGSSISWRDITMDSTGANVAGAVIGNNIYTGTRGCDSSTSGSVGTGPGAHRVAFVTSTTYNGANIIGTSGADNQCNTRAAAAGLPGSFKAWLSNDAGQSPSTRFEQSPVPYLLPTGTKIADNWADLTDGTLASAINRDESGTSRTGNNVWTNTLVDGTYSSANDCGDWNATTGSGGRGTDSTTGTWTNNGTGTCSSTYRLYCFQQFGGETPPASCAETWAAAASTPSASYSAITYGKGLFVATAYTSSNQIITSPDGITWTPRTSPVSAAIRNITYGNGRFVGVISNASNYAMTSDDGITWTLRTGAQANQWFGVTYGDGLYVAVAIDGTNRVMTSPDGVTWTARSASQANQWRDVEYGNGLYVAVASSGTNRVMTSPDGITWTNRTASQANEWQSIAYGNGMFVAVATTGTNRVMTSPNGITWTNRTAAEANSWRDVTFGNGLFVAVSMGGTNRVMTSPDGINWTARAAPAGNEWQAVAYGNGRFVAVSQDGTNRAMYSICPGAVESDWEICDGTDWQPMGSSGEACVPDQPVDFLATRKKGSLEISYPATPAHGCSIRNDGTAWCWGKNNQGQLGNNTTTDSLTPVQVHSDLSDTGWNDWTYIGSGAGYSCGLRANGTAWCWGRSTDGALGINSTVSNPRPAQVHSDTTPFTPWNDWAWLSVGYDHTCGIRTNGIAYCWGDADTGKLGNNQTSTNSLRPTAVHSSGSATPWEDWKKIFPSNATSDSTCGIRADGSAWCWGSNGYGKLGDNTTTDRSRPVKVHDNASSAGWNDWVEINTSSSTCGLRANGTVWCWGANGYGQLGLNTQDSSNHPRPAAVVTSSGSGQWTDWTSITTMTNGAGVSGCGTRANGTAWCWGAQTGGRLGNNVTSGETARPVQVHSDSSSTGWTDWLYVTGGSCGVRADGSAWCWGHATDGRLGNGVTTPDAARPVRVAAGGVLPAGAETCSGGGAPVVGGYVWYLAGNNESCDAACSSHGGCNLAGTRDYAGSGGTNANCLAVVNAMGYPGPVTDQNNFISIGCNLSTTNTYRSTSLATTCSASFTGQFRFCACND